MSTWTLLRKRLTDERLFLETGPAPVLTKTHKIMNYKVVSATTTDMLTHRVNELLDEGYELVGGHTVVETQRVNRFSGSQHMDTLIKCEYSQTMIKN